MSIRPTEMMVAWTKAESPSVLKRNILTPPILVDWIGVKRRPTGGPHSASAVIEVSINARIRIPPAHLVPSYWLRPDTLAECGLFYGVRITGDQSSLFLVRSIHARES